MSIFKKMIFCMSSITFVTAPAALVSSCSAKNKMQYIDAKDVKSTNNSGGFQFKVSNVKSQFRISDGGKLSNYFSCFDSKGKKLVTDVRAADGKRDWYKGKKYSFLVTAYLFNDDGRDRDVNEEITFCSVNKNNEADETFAKIKINHKAVKEGPFSLKSARVINTENGWRKFCIIPDSSVLGISYGDNDKTIVFRANLENQSKIYNPEISNVSVENNGWDIYITLKNDIELSDHKQALYFSISSSDNKGKNITSSITDSLEIPEEGPEISDVEVNGNFGDNPNELTVWTNNIKYFDISHFKVLYNGKEVKIASVDLAYPGSSTVYIKLQKQIEKKGTIEVQYLLNGLVSSNKKIEYNLPD